MKKPHRISFRIDDDTYNWLEGMGKDSPLSVAEVAREVLMVSRMSKDTKAVYGKCLEYLGSLDSTEFLQGLDGLIAVLKEVKSDG
ncbi:MAG: hypothetical protein RMX65_016605 [Nostoc sp. DedQUE01]|nr:hypothetical protein [Nostoc sp. DedQUE01]